MEENNKMTVFSMENLMSIPRGVLHEFSTPMPDRTGSLKIAITDSMGIVDGTMITNKATVPLGHYNDKQLVEMNFMLEGNILQTHEGLLHQHHYQKGYHNILFNPFSQETNQLLHSGTHHIFSVHMLPEKMAALFTDFMPEMNKYAEKILKGEPFVIHAPVNRSNQALNFFFKNFWDTSLPQSVGKLYLESRVMELLARQCDQLLGKAPHPTVISRTDLEKIHHAHAILTVNLISPPSLTELSQLIQLNQFKLKKYFKQVFGMSVFGFVQEERLIKAKQMIREGEKNISGIAYNLGYAHPQHFHRAFKKRFGVSPGSLS